MDALAVAPDYHRLAMENEVVRVLDTCIQPGETVPLHCHQWPSALYVLSWSDFVRRNEHGEVLLDTRATNIKLDPGQAIWSGPLDLHTLENVGDAALHIVCVEIKSTP